MYMFCAAQYVLYVLCNFTAEQTKAIQVTQLNASSEFKQNVV